MLDDTESKVGKTVDQYLDEVNYSSINDYVPTEFALSMVNFIKLVEGGDPENKTPVVHLRMLDNFVIRNQDVINLCHRGLAKALSLDTTVITPNGRVSIADLKVGDRIFGEDGKLATVTHKSEVFNKPMYRITLVDGRTLDVSEDHINVIIQQGQRIELTTKELVKLSNVSIPLPSPLELPHRDLTIDPYTVGVSLGDGCRRYDYKFVPQEYLFGSEEQRLSILQGLMDANGTCSINGCSSFSSSSHQLVLDVCFLVQSLGGHCTPNRTGKTYRANVYLNMAMYRIPVKRNRQSFKVKDSIAIESIEPIDKVPSQCIRVDNQSHTFIANDFIVTHNTSLVEYLIWYIAVFNKLPNLGEVPYALYISDSIDNGIKRMRKSIENRYNYSDFLQKMLPTVNLTDTRWEFINADARKLVVTGHGAKSGVRGTRENNSRPILALLDDLISDEDARSPTVLAGVEETVYKAVEYALHPKRRKVIWNGTPFHAGDPLYKAIESGSWTVNVYPVCEKFPCKRSEFRGSWEDRFTYDSVNRSYLKAKGLGRVDSFEQELMLRIHSKEDRLIEDEEIQWYCRDTLINTKENYNFYITTDFATSEKRSADYSVISVWAYSHAGQFYWVDGICKKQLMDKNVDDLFRLCQIYNPQSVGIEISGQQSGFVSWIQKEMMARNVFFNLASQNNSNVPGIRPTTQKFTRFTSIIPMFKTKLFYFPEQLRESDCMVECMTELRLVVKQGFKSKHDDFLDTISMLSMMSLWKPSEPIGFAYNDRSGLWEEDSDDFMESGFSNYII